jgi:hypothetical protein
MPVYLTAWVFLPDPSADGHCIFNEYAGLSADEQRKRRGSIVGRVRIPTAMQQRCTSSRDEVSLVA